MSASWDYVWLARVDDRTNSVPVQMDGLGRVSASRIADIGGVSMRGLGLTSTAARLLHEYIMSLVPPCLPSELTLD